MMTRQDYDDLCDAEHELECAETPEEKIEATVNVLKTIISVLKNSREGQKHEQDRIDSWWNS